MAVLEHWREQLIAAALRDRDKRAELVARGELFDGYHPEMEAVHNENADLLERAIAEIGWPGRAMVEDDGAGAAFLIAQHAIGRPALQRRALELLLEAIPQGQANPLDAAYLSDRIATYEGRPQIFGTQFDWDENGALSPLPVAEPSQLDERRASVGLPPIAEVTAGMRERAAAEGETRPDDYATRREQFEKWLRRVGWRA